MPHRAAISLSADAVSKACARLSSTQGPAISASGSALPMRTLPIVTVELGFAAIIIPAAGAVFARGERRRLKERALDVGDDRPVALAVVAGFEPCRIRQESLPNCLA